MRFAAFILIACCIYAQTGDHERARQLLTSGRAAEAAGIYRELLRAHSDSSDLMLNLSIAEYKAGRFREAAESAAGALKRAPGLLPAKLFLGASYLELGEFIKAVDSLEPVIAADPRERNGRLMLAEALLGAGRPAAAVKHFRAAADMLPTNPRVWYGLGRSYEALGEKNNAAEAWEQLMTLPRSLQFHVHAAEIHDAALRWREAAAEWREALKVAPDNLNARSGLAWSLFRSRDYNAAMETLKPLLRDQASASVQFLFGAALLNLGQPAEAMPYLRSAVAADPSLLPARAALGQALLQTGRPEDAIPFLRASTSVDQDGSLHFQLFRAYQLTQRKAEAQEALAAYRRLRATLGTAQ